MSYQLSLIRDSFTDTTTCGKLYLNGEYICETLEDKVRPDGEKIDGKTAIPEGTYQVNISMSSRFKREMPIIYNQLNGYELNGGGISFQGIRIHGGNTHENSHGCILVAKKRVNANLICETMEATVTKKLIELGRKGYITISKI